MATSYNNWQMVRSREPVRVGDFSERISLLRFEKIENGILYGFLEGREARVVIGDNRVESIFPGEFSFSVIDILPLLRLLPAPEGMHFVASKNGKYFYPLDAPEAALIAPKNRIFFASEKEAYEKGFQRRKK